MFKWLKNKVIAGKEGSKEIIGTKNIKENWSDIKEMSQKLLVPSKSEVDLSQRKTFAQVVLEKKLSHYDLAQIYKNYAISFYISVVFAALCVGGFVYTLFFLGKFFPAMASLAFTLVCLANAFRFSFFSFRIKHQKFCSFQDWLNNPKQWLPSIF